MKLKQIREAYGFNQSQMANLIGIKLKKYVQYELELESIPDSVVARIRRKFDLEAIAFLAARVRI